LKVWSIGPEKRPKLNWTEPLATGTLVAVAPVVRRLQSWSFQNPDHCRTT